MGFRISCKTCEITRRTQFRKANKTKENATARKRYDPHKAKEAAKQLKDKNPTAFRDYARVYRDENRDAIRKRNRRFSCLRRGRVRQATPNWLTEQHKLQILEFYDKAQQLSIETGIKHHVDHICPINGINSCGLHVPWNLQILTETENLSKGNRL